MMPYFQIFLQSYKSNLTKLYTAVTTENDEHISQWIRVDPEINSHNVVR